MKKILLVLIASFSLSVSASPILEMNRAFLATSDLIPFITDRNQFLDKKNEAFILERLQELDSSFISAKHDTELKKDIFAPSYAALRGNITDSLAAFKKKNKDYAQWRLKEMTSLCMDCHTRLPLSVTSSFQSDGMKIDPKRFSNVYNLGIAQLLVRNYIDAKTSFDRSIQDKLIRKDYKDLILPFKQILLIEAKVLKDPENLIKTLRTYSEKKEIPAEVKASLEGWTRRMTYWKSRGILSRGIRNDQELDSIIKKELSALYGKTLMSDEFDIDLLIFSGLLSNYSYSTPKTLRAPELNYWIGWIEKYLNRSHFFSSGDLFLKQCIKKYPTHPMASKCFNEYKSSVEFEFSGSAGTDIPEDILKELVELKKLIK